MFMISNGKSVSGVLILVLLVLFFNKIHNLILEYEDARFVEVANIIKQREEGKNEIKEKE